MITDPRQFYNEKYDKGTYRFLYGNYRQNGIVAPLPSHYISCALYMKCILHIDVNDKILEIGCGTGAFLWEMNRLGYQNIIGIDVADKAKEFSIMPEVTFQGNAAKINFEDNNFDLVVSIGVYEHLTAEDFEPSLKEITRVGKRAVLWIDMDEGNSDHIFNEDEEWWASKIVEVANAKSAFVDKKMIGGSGTHPILINFDLNDNLIKRDVTIIKRGA